MNNANRKSHEIVPPPITVMKDEARRLSALASSSGVLFPRVAHFLAAEIERASVVADDSGLRGVVRMGSKVRYCHDKTGEVQEAVLVYPHEADITLKRISVLTPVGAALIGLSVGQSIEFQTSGNNRGSLTVLDISSRTGFDMHDVSTRQAALSIVGITVVLVALMYLATFFKA